ncbi:MAG: efflux RND transporter periplasmic adaptor subunit [Desulfosporosinus sp.]|jgi:HlyD family secretion protein
MAIEKSRFGLTPNIFKLPNLKHRKFVFIGGLALLILVSVTISNVMPLLVNVITLYPKDFSKGFSEEGEVIAACELPLFNQVEGKLQSLKVKNGDTVKKGQVLFKINTGDLTYQLEGLKAQLQSLEGQRLQNYKNTSNAQIAQQKLIIQQAERDVQTAELHMNRMKVLADAGSISQLEYEEAQTAYDKARNYLEQQKEGLNILYEQNKTSQGTELYFSNQKKVVQTQINQLEEKISKAVVVAPQDGIVKDISLKEGNVVPQGQQVMTLFGNDSYKIESFVLAGDALDIKVGSPVQVLQATSAGNKPFSGKVETVERAAVERISPLGLKEKRVKVTILMEKSPVIILGSSVDVKFTTLEIPDKLLIPKTALFSYKEEDAVWVVQEGKAKIRPVKKGLENDSDVIIEQGLTDGDIVILNTNLTKLKEGKRIRAI